MAFFHPNEGKTVTVQIGKFHPRYRDDECNQQVNLPSNANVAN